MVRCLYLRTVFLALVLVTAIPATLCSAANNGFIEDYNKDGSYPALSGASGNFAIMSPYRTDSTARYNDWKGISGMYNEPRATRNHEGVDIVALAGTLIYGVGHTIESSADVKVEDKGYSSAGGYWVQLRHSETIGSVTYRYDSWYFHLQESSTLAACVRIRTDLVHILTA